MNTYQEQYTALINHAHELIEGTRKVLPLLSEEQQGEACTRIEHIVTLIEDLQTDPDLRSLVLAQTDLMNWTVAALSKHSTR